MAKCQCFMLKSTFSYVFFIHGHLQPSPHFPICFFPWIHGPALSSRCILSWPKSTATCGHGRRRADHGLIGICVTTTELMIFWYVFFRMGKSPVGESVICFISWGVPQANPNYSDLTVTSMFKAAGTIVKCAMVKTWVKCPELGSSIHIHRNCLILYNNFPNICIGSKPTISII